MDDGLSMTSASIYLELSEHMKTLPVSKQKKVLEFAKSLETSGSIGPGTPGKNLLDFAGAISKTDLLLMSNAIAEDCEQIDPNGW